MIDNELREHLEVLMSRRNRYTKQADGLQERVDRLVEKVDKIDQEAYGVSIGFTYRTAAPYNRGWLSPAPGIHFWTPAPRNLYRLVYPRWHLRGTRENPTRFICLALRRSDPLCRSGVQESNP